MRDQLMTEQAFRNSFRDGKAPADAHLRKAFACEVRDAGPESRALDFVISTASVDRMGDTIAVDGWKLDDYRKNPVVRWAHDSSLLPVGRASNVRVEDGKLKALAEFTPAGMARFNDTVFDMLKGGFLSAVSVGFVPLKYAFVDDPERRFGIDFLEQELLEFSVVPIPANPEALIEARAAGIDVEQLGAWARGVLARYPEPANDPEPRTAPSHIDLQLRRLALRRRKFGI